MPRKKRAVAEEAAKAASPSHASNLEKINKAIQKKFGEESVPDAVTLHNVPVVTTGLLSLDRALGVGGWALGRLHSIEGPEHSGKTALALYGIAQVQKAYPDDIVAFIDMEKTYSTSLAHVCGVDTDPARMPIYRLPSAEAAMELCARLLGYEVDEGKWVRVGDSVVRAICFDSWAGSATETAGMAPLSRVGAQWLPQISGMLDSTKTIFWMINQVREKPGVLFGSPEYSPGGKTLKHAQTTRLWIHKSGEEKVEGRRVGHTMRMRVEKNKLAPPFAQVYVDFNYVRGFDRLSDAYAVAKLCGEDFKESPGGNIIKFEFERDGETDEIRANGESAFFTELRSDPEAAEAFLEVVGRLARSGVGEQT